MALPPGVDVSSVRRAMRRAPDLIFQEWRRAFSDIFLDFQRHHQLERFVSQKNPQGAINSRTGALRRSFTVQITGDSLTKLTGRYGSNLVYAAVHEFGATITPKKVNYLTIPFAHGVTRAGVSRRKARDWKPSFFTRSPKNPQNLILWWAGGAKPVPVMVLTKGPVKLPPRLGLAEEWQKFQPRVADRLNEATRIALNKAS